MTTKMISKTQIDQLGNRLRKGPLIDVDLNLLDDYRRSFGLAYEAVVRTIRERTKLQPTGRPAKSTGAIIEKLHRESIRLTQMQDIAGCRVVVPDVAEQDRVVALLRTVFPAAVVIDRRAKPSYSYRAVHVIVRINGTLVEIQIRSLLQHGWAELSEKFSDELDPGIKYGAGPSRIQRLLATASNAIVNFEKAEAIAAKAEARLKKVRETLSKRRTRDQAAIRRKTEKGIVELRRGMKSSKREMIKLLNRLIETVHEFKGEAG